MNGSFWQTAIVLAAVATAIGYLIRNALRRRKAQSACANCPAVKSGRR